MSTLHTVELEAGVVVDLFDPATATPPIPAGSAGYIQNISNREVDMSDTVGFAAFLVIGGKNSQPSISTLTFEAGDAVFLRTDSRKAVITVATP